MRQHIRNIAGTEETYEFSGDMAYADPAPRPGQRYELSNMVFDQGSTTYMSSVSFPKSRCTVLNYIISMIITVARRRLRRMFDDLFYLCTVVSSSMSTGNTLVLGPVRRSVTCNWDRKSNTRVPDFPLLFELVNSRPALVPGWTRGDQDHDCHLGQLGMRKSYLTWPDFRRATVI